MVSLGGFRLVGAAAGRAPGWDEDDAVRPQREAVTAAGVAGAMSAAPMAVNRPAAVRSLSFGAFRLRSYFDDLYNQVYFLPAIVDFGTISGESSRGVVVWNAHLHPVTLDDVGIRNASGISLEGDVPRIFAALALTTYTFTAHDDPEIYVDGFADFAFSPTELHSIKLIGTRAILAPWRVNWRESYTVTHEFKTDIFTSRAGREQRRALRQTARKRLEFTGTFKNGRARSFLAMMSRSQNSSIILPEVTLKAVSTAEMVAGAQVMQVAATPDWLVQGATVVLVYGDRNETMRVAGTSDDGISFLGTSANSWPAGTRVHPGRRGLVSNSIAVALKTNTVNEAPIAFEVNPGSEELVPIAPAPASFNGRELWTLRPNWGEDISLELARTREMIDFGQGRITSNSPEPFGSRNYTAVFMGRDSDAMKLIEDFFKRQMGQRGEFYMPTWNADIEIKLPAQVGSKIIRIDGPEFFSAYNGDTVQRAVAVLRKDGTWLYNAVESIGQITDNLGDDSAIQVVDPWPVEIRPDNVRMICWLPVWRFATDTLAVEWLTNEVAKTQIAMKTLEDLA